jgi:hypothetical protein
MRRFVRPDKGLRSKDQGWQTVPEQWRGNVPQRSWGAQRDHSRCGGRGAFRPRQTCGASLRVNSPVMRRKKPYEAPAMDGGRFIFFYKFILMEIEMKNPLPIFPPYIESSE